MDWKIDPEYYNVYFCKEIFNGYTYNVRIYAEKTNKAVKFWVGASSGKKRKELNIFENKPNKSLAGIKALLWIKQKMYDFPKYYKSDIENQYICIKWADSRRRDIYGRLQAEGFQFMTIDGEKILIKKLSLQ